MSYFLTQNPWNLKFILKWLEAYEDLGPLPGIAVPMLESFVPVLPLVAILVTNAAAYGLWLGFLYSWAGVCIGSAIVFSLSRRFGKRFTHYIHRRFPKSKSLFRWIETRGFTPLFVLSCFPFTPSFLVNILSGLSNISPRIFMIAIFSGKAVMIFIVSLAGYDLASVIREPVKLFWIIVMFTALWALGRYMQSRFPAS